MRAEPEVVLEARGVVKSLRRWPVLHGVDLTVRAGEIHALVGMNGAGKTTLLRILLGMLASDEGTASLFGSPVRSLPARRWQDVGQMIETPSIYPELTARENITAAALLRGVSWERVAEDVTRVVAELDMGRWIDQRTRRLSLGTRQKVALAAALVHRPTALVLDEPGNALDPSAVVRVRELLSGLARSGAAVLVSSHHLDELARLADTVTVLHRGRVVGGLDPQGVDIERAFFEKIRAADEELPEEFS